MGIYVYSYYDVPEGYFDHDKDKACDLIVHDHEKWLKDTYRTGINSLAAIPVFNDIILKVLKDHIYDYRPHNMYTVIKCRIANSLDKDEDKYPYKEEYNNVYINDEIAVGVRYEEYLGTYYQCYFDFVLSPKVKLLLKMGD